MVKVYIISGDELFSSATAIELREMNYFAGFGKKYSKGFDIYLVDADFEELPSIPSGAEQIFFSKYNPDADLCRPFRIIELKKLIDSRLFLDSDALFSGKNARIIKDGEHLSEKEKLLLTLLYENYGNVVDSSAISERVFGKSDGDYNRVRVYVNYLRKKLTDKYEIVCRSGEGYKLI